MTERKGKRIVYYDWNSLMQQDMLLTLQEAGCEVIRTRQRIVDYLHDERFAEHLARLLVRYQPEFCFSFNFFPVISEVCQREGVRYVSWIFDSPVLTLFHRSVKNSCNRLFFFDRGGCERLAQEGIEHLYHLPLAARPGKTAELLQKGGLPEHNGVTMVGRIYDKKNLYDQIHHLPERLTGYLEGVMEAQKKVWGYNFLEECLDDMRMEEIGRYVKLECPQDCFYTPSLVFANLFLGQKLTAMEREEALLALSRSVPLRVFDITEAGGFVLSNYQQELVECFEPDKEIVLYSSMEEMTEKAKYYLSHEEERQKIAEAGYRRLCAEHTFMQRFLYICSLL